MRYRKISVQIWNDARFSALSDDGKLAFLFLLTHPSMTSVGAMRGTLAGLAEELRWSSRRLRLALAPALQAGMVEVNPTAAYIALPKFVRHNPAENANVAKGWVYAILTHLPECGERDILIDRCRSHLDTVSRDAFDHALREAFPEGFPQPFKEPLGKPSREPFPKPLGERLPKPFRTPEQEQEQEQEQKTPPVVPLTGDRSPASPSGFDRFWTAYPSKVGKDKARQTWRKKQCEPITDQVLAGLERTRAHLTREQGQFIPNPSTWLNQGRWLDEPARRNGHDARGVNAAWEGQPSGEVEL